MSQEKPWEYSNTVGFKADEVCKLMKVAREASVSEFRYGELSFKLGDVPPSPQEIADNLERRKADLQTAAIDQKKAMADELALLHPEAYEDLIEKSLVGEKVPMPELQQPHFSEE